MGFVLSTVEEKRGLGKIKTSQITLNSPLVAHQDKADSQNLLEYYSNLHELKIDPSLIAAKVDELSLMDVLAKYMNVDLDIIRDNDSANTIIESVSSNEQGEPDGQV